jgi:SAM-dependent methyltransferase
MNTVSDKFRSAALKIKNMIGGPAYAFRSDEYLRHNARRLEHLASLRIPVAGMSVLEVGAGIGDHTHFYIDRGCAIKITEAREENLTSLRRRYPHLDVEFLDMDSPRPIANGPFDLVHCYGLLYHLSKPAEALKFLSENATDMLFLETCVSFGESEEINLISEPQSDPTQAYSATGCRPTRSWVFNRLRALFEYVYVPTTQPCHAEFPLDWENMKQHTTKLQRAVFIASRHQLDNQLLSTSLLMHQTRHP